MLLLFDGLVYEVIGWRQVHAGDTYLMFTDETTAVVVTIQEEPRETVTSAILRRVHGRVQG
jgi:hypothetical protein